MKRLLAASFCVLVGFALGINFHSSALQVAAVGPPNATQNGDTNGDGGIDISDAVYLLNFLFAGGADIAPIKCVPAERNGGFIATGMTECFGDAGPIDCSIPKARGQDGALKLGCPFESRFVDNGDGTVSDTCTGLMWTKKNVDIDQDGEIVTGDGLHAGPDELPWLQACQFADDMTYLGHSDWRVPNIREILDIMRFGVYPNFVQPIAFDQTWSSTYDGSILSIGLNGRNGGCCSSIIHHIGREEPHIFVAVRGP